MTTKTNWGAGFMVIFCVKGEVRRSKFFGSGDSDKAALYVADMAQKGWDVYFGQGFLKNPSQSPSRGKETDVEVIQGLWFDGDIKGGIHKEDSENLPTKKELETFLRDEIPFKASQIVASSPDGGRHLHWLYNEPFVIRSEDDRKFIKGLSESFQKVIIKKMKAHGWKQDNTSDLVRVLRIPGTFNFKGDPVPVSMVSDTGYRYTAYSILEWVDMEEEAHDARPSSGGNHAHGDLEKILQSCEFLRHWRDHSDALVEPEWWAGICAIHTEPGAEKAIHEYSKTYPGYTPKETNKKIKEAQKLTGPMSCKKIRDKTGFEGCPSGGCGVAYPVHLGGNSVQWQEPEEIRAELLPVEPLRESMIPEALLPMCEDVATRMSVPIDFVAVPLVVVLGTIIGTGCHIRPKRQDDWTVTPNLWGAIIGSPSALKTPALNEVMRRTVSRLETEESKRHGKEKAEYQKKAEIDKLSKDVLKQEYKNALKEERKQ